MYHSNLCLCCHRLSSVCMSHSSSYKIAGHIGVRAQLLQYDLVLTKRSTSAKKPISRLFTPIFRSCSKVLNSGYLCYVNQRVLNFSTFLLNISRISRIIPKQVQFSPIRFSHLFFSFFHHVFFFRRMVFFIVIRICLE